MGSTKDVAIKARRIRTNSEIRAVTIQQLTIRARSLEWLGHVVRIGDQIYIFNIFNSQPVGRPRQRLIGNCQNDVKLITQQKD